MTATHPPWPVVRATSTTAYPAGVASRRRASWLARCRVSVTARTSSRRSVMTAFTASVLLLSDWTAHSAIPSTSIDQLIIVLCCVDLAGFGRRRRWRSTGSAAAVDLYRRRSRRRQGHQSRSANNFLDVEAGRS